MTLAVYPSALTETQWERNALLLPPTNPVDCRVSSTCAISSMPSCTYCGMDVPGGPVQDRPRREGPILPPPMASGRRRTGPGEVARRVHQITLTLGGRLRCRGPHRKDRSFGI